MTTMTIPGEDLDAIWSADLPPCEMERPCTCGACPRKCGEPSVAVVTFVCAGDPADRVAVCADCLDWLREQGHNLTCPDCRRPMTWTVSA